MKSFTSFINEKLVAGKGVWGVKSLIQLLYNIGDVGSIYIPLSTSIIRKIQEPVFATGFHKTDHRGIAKLIAIQKQTTKSVSVSNAKRMLERKITTVGTGVETLGGIVVKLNGEVLAAFDRDVYSVVSSNGTRWVNLNYLLGSGGVFGYTPEEEIEEFRQIRDSLYAKHILSLAKKYENEYDRDPLFTYVPLKYSIGEYIERFTETRLGRLKSVDYWFNYNDEANMRRFLMLRHEAEYGQAQQKLLADYIDQITKKLGPILEKNKFNAREYHTEVLLSNFTIEYVIINDLSTIPESTVKAIAAVGCPVYLVFEFEYPLPGNKLLEPVAGEHTRYVSKKDKGKLQVVPTTSTIGQFLQRAKPLSSQELLDHYRRLQLTGNVMRNQ